MESASCTLGLTGHQDIRGTRWDQSGWWICCRGKTQGSRGVASFLATFLERGAQMGKPRLHFSGQKQTTSCKAGWPLGDSLSPPPVELPSSQTVPRLYLLALFRDMQACQVSWNSHACSTPNWQGSKVAWVKGLRFVEGQKVFRGMMYSVYIFWFCWNISQYLRSLIARVFPCKQRQHWRACPDTGKDKHKGHALLQGGMCKHTHPVCSQKIAGSPQSPQCGMPAHLRRGPLEAMHVIPSHQRACLGLFLKSILCRFCNVKFQ